MSPIPESEPRNQAYFGDELNIKTFFYSNIDSEEKRSWHVHLENEKAEMAWFGRKGVNFKNRLEQYSTGNPKNGIVFHTVFTTEQPGVYLELTSDEPFSMDDPRVMVRLSIDKIFHRLGENADKEYIESLLNG